MNFFSFPFTEFFNSTNGFTKKRKAVESSPKKYTDIVNCDTELEPEVKIL